MPRKPGKAQKGTPPHEASAGCSSAKIRSSPSSAQPINATQSADSASFSSASATAPEPTPERQEVELSPNRTGGLPTTPPTRGSCVATTPVQAYSLDDLRPARQSLSEWYEMCSESGDERGSPAVAQVELKTAMRGLCSEYFELHVSPVLRAVQSTQEQQQMQLQELRLTVGTKADSQAVPSLTQLQDLVAGEIARRSEQQPTGVHTHVRLQELSAALQRKADSSAVPTLAQHNALVARLDSQKESPQPDAAKLSEIVSGLEGRLHSEEMKVLSLTAGMEKLNIALTQKADSAAVQEQLASRAAAAEQGGKPAFATAANAAGAAAAPLSEVKKVQMLVVAAGARFDKQLRELREQVKSLREEKAGFDERWPGRVIGSGPASETGKAPSETGSDAASGVGSLAAASVVTGLGPEDRAELKKTQAIIIAAGTAFSKDLREIKKQMRGLDQDINKLKELAGLRPS